MKPSDPSQRIDELIAGLADWRGQVLATIRRVIHEADPDVVEDWQWMGTPTWSHDGLFALANAHKEKVKLTFYHGANLPDPHRLFNAGLAGNQWRAIDVHRDDRPSERRLRSLIRGAVAYNRARSKERRPSTRPRARTRRPPD